MRCPDCRADDVAAIEMVWSGGAPGSVLSAAARPPSKQGMFWPGVAVAAIAVVLAAMTAPDLEEGWRGVLWAGALVGAFIAIAALSHSANGDLQARLKRWRANWVCRRCGHIAPRSAFEAEGRAPGDSAA